MILIMLQQILLHWDDENHMDCQILFYGKGLSLMTFGFER